MKTSKIIQLSAKKKEKFAVDTHEELAHQRIKIKLLQEALTNRNQEFASLEKKNKRLVILLYLFIQIDPFIRK